MTHSGIFWPQKWLFVIGNTSNKNEECFTLHDTAPSKGEGIPARVRAQGKRDKDAPTRKHSNEQREQKENYHAMSEVMTHLQTEYVTG